MRYTPADQPQASWPAKGGAIALEGAMYSNSLPMLLGATLRGAGIAMLPLALVRPFLEEEALVLVLPGVLEIDTALSVVYAEREFVTPQVRAFVDAVVAWAPGALDRPLPPACVELARGTRPRRRALRRG
jgi:DNA-binding transcriptional LysR family regulator